MSDSETAYEDIRGSTPVMTTKDLLLEVYKDMKFVRPALEGLLAAGLVARVEALERDKIARDASGVERRRIGDVSGRTLVTIILVSNFIIGLIVLFAGATSV